MTAALHGSAKILRWIGILDLNLYAAMGAVSAEWQCSDDLCDRHVLTRLKELECHGIDSVKIMVVRDSHCSTSIDADIKFLVGVISEHLSARYFNCWG